MLSLRKGSMQLNSISMDSVSATKIMWVCYCRQSRKNVNEMLDNFLLRSARRLAFRRQRGRSRMQVVEPTCCAACPGTIGGRAGSFHQEFEPERKTLIFKILSELAKNGVTPICPQRVNTSLVPHAGLRYSGHIATEVWRRLHLHNDILIIGPKHTAEGASQAVSPHETWK